MKILVLTILILTSANAVALENSTVKIISNAIYLAEGGDKTRHPYGVESVKVKNKEEARRVCENTIRNNYKRWMLKGSPGKFLDFLGDRYCPPKGLFGTNNKNWKRNVRKLSGLDI
jgi:hypothetical protein